MKGTIFLLSLEQEDYFAMNGSQLIFTSSNLVLCLNVTILDDTILEDAEGFDLVLQTTASNVIFMPSVTTIWIEDNEEICKSSI